MPFTPAGYHRYAPTGPNGQQSIAALASRDASLRANAIQSAGMTAGGAVPGGVGQGLSMLQRFLAASRGIPRSLPPTALRPGAEDLVASLYPGSVTAMLGPASIPASAIGPAMLPGYSAIPQ